MLFVRASSGDMRPHSLQGCALTTIQVSKQPVVEPTNSSTVGTGGGRDEHDPLNSGRLG